LSKPTKVTATLCILTSVTLHIQSVYFSVLLDVQNILSADIGISRQTEGQPFGDHLISRSVIECHERCFALFCVFTTRLSQCPISLRSEQPLYCRKKLNLTVKLYNESVNTNTIVNN
jgi:hypothetical protein